MRRAISEISLHACMHAVNKHMSDSYYVAKSHREVCKQWKPTSHLYLWHLSVATATPAVDAALQL